MSATATRPSCTRLGREGRRAVEAARAAVAAALNAGEREIVFTSGGTEADNLALAGYLERFEPGHLIVSAIEHAAVIETARALARRGWALDVVPVDRDGLHRPRRVRRLRSAPTRDSPR